VIAQGQREGAGGTPLGLGAACHVGGHIGEQLYYVRVAITISGLVSMHLYSTQSMCVTVH